MSTAVAREKRPGELETVDHRRISLIGLAHLANDLSGNFFSSLTPYLVIRGAISATVAGLVVFVYLVGSSILQPIFGVMSDRQGRKIFAVIGPFWLSCAAGLAGWVTHSWQLLALAFIGGLGTAAFHPQAAAMVDSLSPRHKGRSMAVFSMGGNIGFAIGPLVAATVAGLGLHWSLLVICPAAVVTAFMAVHAPRPRTREIPFDGHALVAELREKWRPLTVIVVIIAFRSAVQLSLIVFLPLYYRSRGFAPEIGSYLAFVLSLSGAIGGIFGGHMSDLYGRRLLTVVTLGACAPAIGATLAATGPIIWPLIAVSGLLLLASNSVMVVSAQALLPAQTGLASGLTMGLGFGLSGLVTAALSVVADHASVTTAVTLIPVLAFGCALLALLMPPDGGRGQRAESRSSEARASA